MEIRKLNLNEHEKTKTLYKEVFSTDSQGFVDYYYTEKVKDNQMYVMEDDDKIVGMLHLNPYTLKVNGLDKETNYIVAVATKEEYRKRGIMRNLLTKALHDMYEEHQTFTFLMPAAESIYLPYDFRTVYEQNHTYYANEHEGKGFEIKELQVEECEELANSMNQFLGSYYQVYANRNKEYFERLKKEYESDGAKLMLYRKDGNIVDMRPCVPDEDIIKGTKPKIMIRIIDVRRMLMSMRLKSLMAVAFHVTDPVIEENNRCLVMTGTEFSGVMLMDSKPENSEGTITIAALASLLFGGKTVEEICEEDGVIMSERMKSEMKKIVPLNRIYLNEIV